MLELKRGRVRGQVEVIEVKAGQVEVNSRKQYMNKWGI